MFLENLQKFTGKHLCWIFILIKLLAALKKRHQHRCFLVNFELVNFAKFLKTVFKEHLHTTASGYNTNLIIPKLL